MHATLTGLLLLMASLLVYGCIEERNLPPGDVLSNEPLDEVSEPDVECVPACDEFECGPDGCGGTCGTCGNESSCVGGQCVPVCATICAQKECGEFGDCDCGTCPDSEVCELGACVDPCDEVCAGKECGGLAGCDCGQCALGSVCITPGLCCTPNCEEKECGGDGCDGTCLPGCGIGEFCNASGLCQTSCTPDCVGKECGNDGCDGTCLPGCGIGEFCNASGLCQTSCTPDCVGKECGNDGCGGSCGDCLEFCDEDGQCAPWYPNGFCDNGETCETHPEDCGECPPPECPNAICSIAEDCTNCPGDCGECITSCEGNCDTGFVKGSDCQCDPTCKVFGTCCDDKCQFCNCE